MPRIGKNKKANAHYPGSSSSPVPVNEDVEVQDSVRKWPVGRVDPSRKESPLEAKRKAHLRQEQHEKKRKGKPT